MNVKPLYDTYCFSQIPHTILHLLTGKAGGLPKDCFDDRLYDRVILILLDGFGWRFFEKYRDRYPFLKRFAAEGKVSKITSQFPSTTAAHVTCLNTGLDVGQTGIYEWFYYEPKVGRVIAPLLFSLAGEKEVGTLSKLHIDPRTIYPSQSIYTELKEKGIASYIFQQAAICNSPFSMTMFRDAENIPYVDLEAGLKLLVSTVREKKGYFYLYISDFDAAAHRHGVDSEEVETVIDRFFAALEKHLAKELFTSGINAAVLVTADHGMTEIDPATTVYLNQIIPDLESALQRGPKGHLLTPAGSCRDYFLHVQPPRRAEVMKILKEKLAGIAEVFPIEELIKAGFFGKAPSQAFLERVGNVVVLPGPKQSVWWYEKNKFEQKFYGMHGGLSQDEMESIFLFLHTK